MSPALFWFMVVAQIPPVHATEVSALAGTWNATTTATGMGTCEGSPVKGTIGSTIWLVSTSPDGTLSVSVQGDSAIPTLSGVLRAGRVTLQGYTKFNLVQGVGFGSTAWYSLEVKADGTLTGIREFMALTKVALTHGEGFAPCFVLSEVALKR